MVLPCDSALGSAGVFGPSVFGPHLIPVNPPLVLGPGVAFGIKKAPSIVQMKRNNWDLGLFEWSATEISAIDVPSTARRRKLAWRKKVVQTLAKMKVPTCKLIRVANYTLKY